MADGLLGGGLVTIEWDASSAATVTITGTRDEWTVNGEAVSFPYTLSETTTFATNKTGRYTVTVSHEGLELESRAIHLKADNTFRFKPGLEWNQDTWGKIVTAQNAAIAGDIPDPGTPIGAALSATYARGDQRPDPFPAQFLSYSKGGRVGTSGRMPVALRFDDWQDNILSMGLLDELRSRDLFGSIVLVSQLGANNWNQVITWDDLRAWNRNYGMEVWSHGTNHATPHPDGYDGLVREIVTSKEQIEAQDIRVMGWARPGVEDPGFGPELDAGDWTSEAGRLLTATYGAVETDMTGGGRVVPSDLRYGLGHVTVSDGWTLQKSKNALDSALLMGVGIEFMCHAGNLDKPGYMTYVEFKAFLDYIVEKRDAGLIEFVTPSSLVFCDPGSDRRLSLIGNGDFSQPIPADNIEGNWQPATVNNAYNTIVTVPDGPEGSETKVLQVAQSGQYARPTSWSNCKGRGVSGQTMMLDFWARGVSGTAGGIRVIAQGGTWTSFLRDFRDLDTTWRRVRMPFTLPPSEDTLVVGFGRAYSGATAAQITNIKLYPA